MKHRTNPNHIWIVASDSAGNHAPPQVVDVSGVHPEKRYEHALKEAKQRSGLSRYSNWKFR